MKLSILLVSGLLLHAVPASALELQGVTLPETATASGKSLTLNGAGLRLATIFNAKVYVGALYLEKRSADPVAILASSESKRVELHFLRDVGADKIQETWKDNFKAGCAKDCDTEAKNLASFIGWLSEDVKKGDVHAFDFGKDRVTLTIKGTEKGSIASTAFARIVLGSWLGSNPPNKSLKEGMLGAQ